MGWGGGLNVRPGFPVGSCLLSSELSCSDSAAGGEDDSGDQEQPLHGSSSTEEGVQGWVCQPEGCLQPSAVRLCVSNHLCPRLTQMCL